MRAKAYLRTLAALFGLISLALAFWRQWYEDAVLHPAAALAPDPASGRVYLIHMKPDGYVVGTQYDLYNTVQLIDTTALVLFFLLAIIDLARAGKSVRWYRNGWGSVSARWD